MSSIIRLRDYCLAHREWLVETIQALVRFESPTLDKAAVDRCGAELTRRLEAIGGRVLRLPQRERGAHLRVEFSSATATVQPHDRQILLLGHFDTVWPIGQLERMPLDQRDGRLHGPGIFDMKSGIALGMLATRALLEAELLSSRRLVMLWTSDEEVGSATSRDAIEEEARRSAAVLVLEPSLPGGALKTSRKACGQYEMLVRGVAAHAGVDPGSGASAIHELAHQICRLYQLPPKWTGLTLNVGTVAGGTRPNVVAEEARAVIDVRAATQNEMDMFDSVVRRQTPRDPRTSIAVTGGFDRPPLERSAGVIALFERARDLAAQIGTDLAEGTTGGGSDGNFTAALGVPTLDGLGAVGDGAHALHEHVIVDALPDRAAIIAGLIESI